MTVPVLCHYLCCTIGNTMIQTHVRDFFFANNTCVRLYVCTVFEGELTTISGGGVDAGGSGLGGTRE